MTRSELIRAIALKSSLTQDQAEEAMKALIDVFVLAVSENESISITGLGRFNVSVKPPAERVNPGTGEKVEVPERKFISFKPSKAFKSRISE